MKRLSLNAMATSCEIRARQKGWSIAQQQSLQGPTAERMASAASNCELGRSKKHLEQNQKESIMAQTSLTKRQSSLAFASEQLRVLESNEAIPSFNQILASHGQDEMVAQGIEVLQINVGKVCNQTCTHCHVDAGPDRRESMSEEIASECLRVLKIAHIPTLDITGGAPEMNPQFRRLVAEAASIGKRIIDRCNLTILLAPKFDDLPEYLAAHRVEIVASLPCYLEENVDKQRGNDVFRRSIEALKRLNRLGYGLI